MDHIYFFIELYISIASNLFLHITIPFLFQNYFDVLNNRINSIGRKKIPVVETTINHPDPSLSGYRLQKYSWSIYNLAHLKLIFNNSLASISTSRSFIANRNGTYQSYEPQDNPMSQSRGSNSSGSSKQPMIRPHDFRTVLRVGVSVCQAVSKQIPFIIEWVPNVLPISRMGQFSLIYECEHIHNGQVLRTDALKDMPNVRTSAAPRDGNVPILPGPIIVSAHSLASQTIAGHKRSTHLTPIAPKLSFKDSTTLDEKTLLDIAMPQDTIIDSENYAFLQIPNNLC